MLGFKRFETVTVTIRGIELAAKIKKKMFSGLQVDFCVKLLT